MSLVYRQQTSREHIGLITIDTPLHVHHHSGKASTYEDGGCTHNASCVGCHNPPCLRFSPDELKLTEPRLRKFPVDADDSVCPVNAIVWEREERVPKILSERCINCGICARRCPFGAIFSDGKTGIINNDEAEVTFVPVTDDTMRYHLSQAVLARSNCHTGQYAAPTADYIDSVYEKLEKVQIGTQFPNLLVRNLLIVLGNKCIIRRRGDVYFRVDAIISDDDMIGISEIGFRRDSLESPRAILDDIAVLSARYGLDKREIKPLVVLLEFPNSRTEYWRVIKDIKEVLDIRIHSLTLGALCLLVWSFRDISIRSMDFYADMDESSIRMEVGRLCGLGGLPKLSNHAVLEPIK